MMRSIAIAVLVSAAPATGLTTPRLAPRITPTPSRTLTTPKMVTPAAAAAWIGGSVALGASGAAFVVPNLKPWYESLNKPPWSPPNKVFAPVRSMLRFYFWS